MTALLTPREKAGRIFVLLGWIQVFVLLAISATVLIPHAARREPPSPMALLFVLFLALPVLYISVGKAIKRRRDWGRVLGVLLAIAMLFGFPVGTVIGAYLLYCLLQGWDQPGA